MFFDGFIHLLREYGVPASMTDALDFYRGLDRGVAPDPQHQWFAARPLRGRRRGCNAVVDHGRARQHVVLG